MCCLQEVVFTIVLAAILNSTVLLQDIVMKDELFLLKTRYYPQKHKKLLARVPSDHIQGIELITPLTRLATSAPNCSEMKP